MKKMKKMYIIINGDLEPIYGMVQGSHALAEFAIKFPKLFKSWNNQYLIFLRTKNEKHFLKEYKRLKNKRIKIATFNEPDLNNKFTAFALFTNKSNVSKLKIMSI